MSLDQAAAAILQARREAPATRAILVAITGIDGSGKGYITGKLEARLLEEGRRLAVLNIDSWLNLPSRRFNPADPARHFYEHGLRLPEMFSQLVLPLKAHRSIWLAAELADATDREEYRVGTFDFADVDIILLDGIFLLKRAFQVHFDRAFWVDCTFETALERALARGQEGLPPERVLRDYQTTYFPAQRIHIERDDPRGFATAVIANDPRLRE